MNMWKFFQSKFSLRSWVTEATKVPHFSSSHFVLSFAQDISQTFRYFAIKFSKVKDNFISYFIEENIWPGAQRLAFEVKYKYIVCRPWIYCGGCTWASFQTTGTWCVKHCISKIAFLELSSWQCCFLRKMSYIDFK